MSRNSRAQKPKKNNEAEYALLVYTERVCGSNP